MKVCVTCFDFKQDNFRRQPWRYIFEITKGLKDSGIEVVVITDVESSEIEGIKIITVKKLKSLLGKPKELLNVLDKEDPDIIVMNIGLTTFLRFNIISNKPIIGILTSPIHSLKEVLNIGIQEILRNHKNTFIHLIGALIPHYFVRKNSKHFDHIVVLSNSNKIRLKQMGVSVKISKIYPGVDETFFTHPDEEKVKIIKQKIDPKDQPLIMYYTSPLTLRGTDTLVKAFSKVRSVIKSKLIILSRREHEYLSKEEVLLEKIALKEGVLDSMDIVAKYLNPEEVKEYISAADIICLPFKLIMSEIPISILESMALGKVVVSTDIGCIPELLDDNVLSKPNNPEELSKNLIELLTDENLANQVISHSNEIIKSFPVWKQVQDSFIDIITGIE